jgi:SAM-dependent methyltransferase
MIAAVGAEAAVRGLDGLEGVVAAAEALPFADASFDMLASRFTAHHWRDFEAGLREARRVLAPGAPAVFVDVVAPEQAQADVHLQTVELLRDPSHVRDYRISEWLAALGRAGFTVGRMTTHPLRMDFASWTERMRTPDVHVAAIRSIQQGASAAVADCFQLDVYGSFTVHVMLVEAV